MQSLLPVSGRYGVSILAEGQEKISDHFAGRPSGGTETDVAFIRKHDMPVLKGAAAYLVCRVHEAYAAGDHTLYIGLVEYLEMWDSRPLLFYAGQYRYLDVERLKQPQWPEDDYSLFSITNF
jgi:flavin reductase (DIM6/NTAB) family NADH-FMN oxidoreductase RutF